MHFDDVDPTIPPAPAGMFDQLPASAPSIPEPKPAPMDGGVGEGLEHLGPSDLTPYLKIAQESTPGGHRVPLGSWFLSSSSDHHACGRELVLLSVTKERALELPDRDDERAAVVDRIYRKTGVDVSIDWDGPVCAAPDATHPVSQCGLPVLSETCAECPLARWRTSLGRRHLDCPERFRFVFFDRWAGHECVYMARGAAFRPARDYLNALDVASRLAGRPAFAFYTYATTQAVERDDHGYFVPVFDRPLLIEDADLAAKVVAARRRVMGGAA